MDRKKFLDGAAARQVSGGRLSEMGVQVWRDDQVQDKAVVDGGWCRMGRSMYVL
jgi:Zn ribbon nucleic-acid-binding protein